MKGRFRLPLLPALTLGLSRTLAYVFLALVALVCLIPLYTTLITVTNFNDPNGAISFLPDRFFIRNFTNLFFGSDYFDFSRAYLNSLIVSGSCTVLTCYFGALTAYGFALFDFPAKKALWAVLLAFMMIPQTVSLVGFYRLALALNMTDTWWPLILPGMANAYVVFYLRQYIGSVIPPSLIEAARIDGCRELSVFHRVVLPNLIPGVAPVLIIVFLLSWNSYLLSILVIHSQRLNTLPVLLLQLRGSGAGGISVAFSMLTVLVLLVLFLRLFKTPGVKDGMNG
jgi:multiple sugar transport system permease protein